jgi:hypothetical protein
MEMFSILLAILLFLLSPPPWLRRVAKRLLRKVRAGRRPKAAPIRDPYVAPTPAHLLVGVHAGPIATCVTTAPHYQPPHIPCSVWHVDSDPGYAAVLVHARFERSKLAPLMASCENLGSP